MNVDIFDVVMALAPKYKGSIAELCRQAEVERDWYNKLMEGKIVDPGVKKIQRLYNVLTK